MIAAGLVAGVFFYFLLFAQFALLQRIEEADAAGRWFQPTMGLMGLGGVLGSLLAWRWSGAGRPPQRLSLLASGCGLAALAAALSASLWLLAFVAAAVGLFLGALTVTLVPTLRQLAPQRPLGLAIGLGVGIAYFFSNAPAVFNASPPVQSGLAAGVIALVALGPPLLPQRVWQRRAPPTDRSASRLDFWLGGVGAWGIVATLFLLVWLDSAAFYAIQRTDSLKVGSWNGEPRLWANAALHLAAALVAGVALGRGKLAATLGVATLCIAGGVACLNLGYGSDYGLGTNGYVIGISLYSCALVAFGVMEGTQAPRWSPAKRAAIAFAVAGWIGSGAGIGMAKDLEGVPSAFPIGAGVFALSILALLKWRQAAFLASARP